MLSVRGEGEGGDGIISGLSPSSIAVPVIPTNEERKNPGFERSMRYHRTGLTNAKVSDTCTVDCQGSLRYSSVSRRRLDLVTRREGTYNRKCNPHKRPNTSHSLVPVGASVA